MGTKEYLAFLQKEIHSTAVATIAEDGRPQVRIIDMMLADDDTLFFVTARGKVFYRQLTEQKYVAVTGQKGGRAVSLRGKVRRADPELLDRVFQENPYMCDIYPGGTRSALEVFQIYEGQGEYFDLFQKPVFRESFILGDIPVQETGYSITAACIGCKLCGPVCPQKCIDFSGKPAVILQEHCLHCGRCAEICPKQSVIKTGRLSGNCKQVHKHQDNIFSIKKIYGDYGISQKSFWIQRESGAWSRLKKWKQISRPEK